MVDTVAEGQILFNSSVLAVYAGQLYKWLGIFIP